MPPKPTVETKLQALQDLIEKDSQENCQIALKNALKEKNNFIVAKAAKWTAERLQYDLIPELVSAYNRFLENPLKHDKTCAAKIAIVRALYDLDFDSPKFYRDGLRYRQFEPVWGGQVDTAVEVRCTSAMGLASTNDHRVMIDLIEILHDEEYKARIGAVKAMEMLPPYQTELVLRHKILQGDYESEVIAQCFSSLMKAAAEESLDFVAACLQQEDLSVCESAAIALGESRLDEALDILIDESKNITLHNALQHALFQAIALHRKDRAVEYLLSVIELEGHTAACDAVEVLAIYSYNQDLKDKVKTRVLERTSKQIADVFEKHWIDTEAG